MQLCTYNTAVRRVEVVDRKARRKQNRGRARRKWKKRKGGRRDGVAERCKLRVGMVVIVLQEILQERLQCHSEP